MDIHNIINKKINKKCFSQVDLWHVHVVQLIALTCGTVFPSTLLKIRTHSSEVSFMHPLANFIFRIMKMLTNMDNNLFKENFYEKKIINILIIFF